MRMWEIRENPDHYYDDDHYAHRMNRHNKDEKEAYECGYEDGYRDAMEEKRSGERRYRRY